MAVVSVKTNLKNAANVRVQACMYGMPCEVVEATEPDAIFMDLIGTEERAVRIAQITGSEVVAMVDSVEMFRY